MRMLLILAIAVSLLTTKLKNEDDITVMNPLASFMQMILEAQAEELKNPRIKYRMFDALCFDLREVDCTGMKPPRIFLFEKNPMRPGLAGYYDGTDIVYVRADLVGDQREEVLAHEMSHYVDQLLGILPEMPVYNTDTAGIIGLCMSEKRAWSVSDEYWKRAHQPRKVVGSTWTRWYKHCTPHKDVLYP
jgi:hypothetical protein